MSDPAFIQILDNLHVGVIVLDTGCRIRYWNHWMEHSSGLPADSALGLSLVELYPGLDSRSFKRNFQSVVTFGIVAYFSPRLHGPLFPFPPPQGASGEFEYMQQSCVMGPIREDVEVRSVYLTVEDVTESMTNQRRLAELALKDGLTGVDNRRCFDRRFADEFDRSERYGHALSVIMIDIDLFKKVNDTHGHQFGDEALRQVASVCIKTVRTTDSLSRYGGEEFCILLPETGLAEAQALAERLRSSVAESPVKALGHSVPITVSAGVACSRPDDSRVTLLARADSALYAAKQAGRNRVEAMA